MKIIKTHYCMRFNIKGLRNIIASILSIPFEIIMFHVFKPKTYYEYLRRGNIFANIREALALRPPTYSVFHTKPYRDPYCFGWIYPDNPNTIVMDDGTQELTTIDDTKNSTAHYIKQIGKMISEYIPYEIIK